MTPRFTVVGIGELLWDFLPDGKQLGGAPANVAYHANALGDHGLVLSRVGADALGDEALSLLRQRGVDASHVQRDRTSVTGTVSVSLDHRGSPSFAIARDSAWDRMAWTDAWRDVAGAADAVCFGTLAQRSPDSRAAVAALLDAVPETCLVVFDVNLRQSFYDAETVWASLARSDVCKLNEHELPIVADLLGIAATNALETARKIVTAFGLQCMAVTRGERGSLLASATDMAEHHGFDVDVRDTVGAGDAFTAGLIHALLRGGDLDEASCIAAQRGAWVASSAGAMPDPATFNASMYTERMPPLVA